MKHAVSLSVITLSAQIGGTTYPVLIPGALSIDCGSALHVGVVTCDGSAVDSTHNQSVSDAQVTEYLAQYGKPPREAVRALLDPSDTNIAAWIRKERQLVSVAGYLASRMTELGLSAGGERPLPGPTDDRRWPAMLQMRATVFFKSGDPISLQAVRTLQSVVNRYPSIDGRLVLVGRPTNDRLNASLANLNALLPISVAESDTMTDISLPSLLIEDLKYRISERISAADVTTNQMCDDIAALRAVAEKRDHALKSMSAEP